MRNVIRNLVVGLRRKFNNVEDHVIEEYSRVTKRDKENEHTNDVGKERFLRSVSRIKMSN